MEKIHLIGWAFLIMLLTASAITVIVSTEAEAQQKLGTQVQFVAGDCKILSVEKEAITSDEITNKPYQAKFEFKYTKDGIPERRVATIETANIDTNSLKILIEKECDETWAELQAENETIDKVIIKPDASEIINQVYGVLTKQWTNI